MDAKTIYVRDKFSAFKTDEAGYERIVKYYGKTKKISKFQYICITTIRRTLQIILFPIWLILFGCTWLFDKFSDWYEDFVRI